MTNRARQIFKPEFRFGLGGVSLGNEFNKHTDKDAEATLEAAWAVGIRYLTWLPGTDLDFRSAASVTFCTTRSGKTICCRPRSESSSRLQRTTSMRKSIRSLILRTTLCLTIPPT